MKYFADWRFSKKQIYLLKRFRNGKAEQYRIGKNTIEKVKKIIADTGYIPSEMARALLHKANYEFKRIALGVRSLILIF